MRRSAALFAVSLSIATLSFAVPAHADDAEHRPQSPATPTTNDGSGSEGPGVYRIGLETAKTPTAQENYNCLALVLGPQQASKLMSQSPQANFCGVVNDVSLTVQ